MQCGILGEKLGHTYSPQIHSMLAEYSYSIFEITADNLEAFLRSNSFTGINVTMPYKKAVIPYLDALSERAKLLGAVNTIVRRPDGTLIGHNTDYSGFLSMLLRTGLDVENKKVLVLGTGGASNTAVAVLRELNADVVTVSRTGETNYSNVHNHSDAALIVNATPVGMYPNNGVSPISLDQFPKLEGVLDLVYNPARTKLLMDAQSRGLRTENGLWMLVAQAKESAEWFLDAQISDSMIDHIYRHLKIQMENIVLVGMPGSGKSTIGKRLAEKLVKTYVDSDEAIEKSSNMTIPDMFDRLGLDHFRRCESDVLKEVCKQSGQVVATGGGCVTIPDNYWQLHQNGVIVWIQRDLDILPTDGRPLSQTASLADMYKQREPLYRSFADIVIQNNSTVEAAVEQIITEINRRS